MGRLNLRCFTRAISLLLLIVNVLFPTLYECTHNIILIFIIKVEDKDQVERIGDNVIIRLREEPADLVKKL